MSSVKQEAGYYSVGGPVQPDRGCYVTRKADEILFSRLAQGEYCQVFAPPDTGKTSLVAHTAERLRDAGAAVATVDLAQISNRDLSEDVGRWYYSFAYRVMRALRVRVNIQSWWQDRAGLTNLQRLREFFLDIVLAQTDQPVVIFVDRIDAVLDRKVSLELFGAIRACHDARATEPEYRRLTFALLGAESVGHKIPQGGSSPFGISASVRLQDFRPDELEQLTVGLGCDAMMGRVIAARVWYWTAGHPYLSQKIFRALARRDGKPDAGAVDAAAAALFLPRNAVREEPHLSAVAEQLQYENKSRVARLSLYGKIRKGGEVVADPMLRTHRELLRSGVVDVDGQGRFTLRNRIYAEVFTAHWVNQSLPFSWRGLGAAAAAIAVVLMIPVWYTEYLPSPYIETLSDPDTDFVNALDAFQRLRFLPGFKGSANDLFRDYLVRESRESASLQEVQRYGERLPELGNRADLQEELLAEFWDRGTQRALLSGRRDDALLFGLRANRVPTPARQRQVGELLGTDFDALLGTIRNRELLASVGIDPGNKLLTLLDARHGVSVWQLSDTGPRRVQAIELAAEEVLPLQSSLLFDARAPGRRLQVAVYTDHPRPTDVQVELRAPSGRTARARLQAEPATEDGAFLIDSRRDPALRALLEESAVGTWTAYFTDTLQGIGGSLSRWELSIDGQSAAAPALMLEAQPIPEPGAARRAISVLSDNGRRALIWPAEPTVRGDILYWNVGSGEVLARIPRRADFEQARFALNNTAVFVTGGRTVEVWNAERAELLLSLPYEPSLPPVLSAGGRFLVVDSILDDSNDNALSIWNLETGKEASQLVTGELAGLVAVDSGGRFLAVGDNDRLVRLWSSADGRVAREFEHGSAPTAVHFDPAGNWIVTEDATHTLRLWSLAAGEQPALVRRAAAPWSVSFDGDWLMLGSLDRGFEFLSLGDRARRGPVLQHSLPGTVRKGLAGGGRLATAGNFAVTWDGETAVKAWRLPPAPDGTGVGIGASNSFAALAPGGAYLATGSVTGDVRIMSSTQSVVLAGQRAPSFIGHLRPITSMRFDANATLLATGALDGSLRVWDVASGAPRAFFGSQADGAVLDLRFTPNAQYLVSASRRSVLVTDATTGDPVARTSIQGARPRLAVNQAGTEIWIAGDRQGITRWRWQAGVVEAGPDVGDDIRRIALGPQGKALATVDAARRLSLWRLGQDDGTDSVRLPAAVDELWFSADGRYLTVQAGPWLQRFAALPGGLEALETRLLSEPPDGSGRGASSDFVSVLFGAPTSRPIAAQVPLASPMGEQLEESSAQWLPRVEAALQLTVDQAGEPLPIAPR
jgi:WD40 repeat protein